jgi:two-component system alkaline phosphatase synthesis response regulator PhoP
MIETEDNNEIRILVVDDNPDMLKYISYHLKKENFTIYTAADDKIAIKKALDIIPHLIILNVVLPAMESVDVCKYLRSYPHLSHVLIAFLSPYDEDSIQIECLNAGGDDYILKPIQPKVLIAKIKSLLRRYVFYQNNNIEEIRRKNFTISKETYTLLYGDKTISLPRKEFEILFLLASKPNKVFKRREIYNTIWGGDGIIVGARTIDVHLRRLRLRTGLDCIKTVKGIGYKYEE